MDFLGPRKTKIVKNDKKNKSCSKLPKMARKLADNYFRIFQLPRPPNKNICGQKSKLSVFCGNGPTANRSNPPELCEML